MKRPTLIAALFAGVAAVPALVRADDVPGQGLSRAQVHAQMRQLADAGYRGGRDETTYPSSVQAAQRRIDALSRPADTSGYGVQWGTVSESGAREKKGPGSLYFGS
ncbi:MAG TPA: DUF4148 domain-containing protein [Trinickia sp.]